jgi:hypothetical protein
MTLLEWLDRIEEARIVARELTDPTARKAVLQPKPMSVSEPRLGQFVPAARSSQQAAISGLASATTTANRTEESASTESPYKNCSLKTAGRRLDIFQTPGRERSSLLTLSIQDRAPPPRPTCAFDCRPIPRPRSRRSAR